MGLSRGALLRILSGEQVEDPVVQVLAYKIIPGGSSNKGRCRLMVSDGQYTLAQAMLSTQHSEKFGQHSVIKLKKYIASQVDNKTGKGPQKILLILDAELISDGSAVGDKIGDPQPLTEEVFASYLANGELPTVKSGKNEAPPSALNQSLSDNRIVTPISGLTPYHNKWVIKARVTHKSEMRSWSNSRGEGKLFSVDLMDESGEIRCTAFRDVAEKYYNYLQVDKVYYISKCQLKAANKQFNTLKNDYEMTIGNESVIEECQNDDGLVPQVKYKFVPISDIANLNVGDLVDVIGICKEASDIQSFTSKSSNRELRKREVILVDQSKTSIALTLWGSQADSFDATNNPVVVIKGAKIGEFGGGKTLSTIMNSQIKLNPDIQECHRIKGWYGEKGQDSDIKNLSERTGAGSFQTAWMNLKDIQDKNLGYSERGDYFQTVATILLVRSENALYKACPTEDCNKKVVDLENGMYRCEKCNREYPNFKYRLLVSMNIGDCSGNQWVSVFSSEAEKILGKTSQEIGLIMEDNSDAGAAIFQEANFKQFIFKCRAKMETYNDEQRLKTVVVKVDPVDYEEHNNFLSEEIDNFLN